MDEITLDTKNKSLKLNMILELKRSTPNASYDYSITIEDGCIQLNPSDSRVRVTNIYPVSGYDSTLDLETEKRKRLFVTIRADMLSDSNNFDYFMEVNEFSNGASIVPDSEDTSFLTAAIEDSLNLATEAHEEQVEECVEAASINEELVVEELDAAQKEDIITRFQQGKLSIFQDFGEPKESYDRLSELDSDSASSRYEYYYDPESDAVVYFVIDKE